MLKVLVIAGFVLLGIALADDCPANYDLYDDGNCYRLLTTPVRQAEGKQRCEAEEATLPEITSALQNAIVTSISSGASVVTWLGLTCSSNNNCQWSDGTSLTYNNFDNGRPDITRGACVFMNVANGKEGLWTSADCVSDFKAVICQKSLEAPEIQCPNAFIKGSDGKCYYAPNIQLLFDDAENLCSDTSSSTYLSSINSNGQNAAIRLIADAAHFTDTMIGLHYSVSGFEWIDGTVFNYENFDQNQPNIRDGSCVAMNVASGKWRSVNCGQSFSFICLKEDIVNPVSSSPRPTPSTTRPTGTTCPVQNSFTGPDVIQSPNYPNYYGGSIECEYHLYVDPGSVVTLRFYEFFLKNIDYIDIFEGDSDSTLLFRLQGTVSSTQWYSTKYSNRMFLRFVSKAGTSNVIGWVLYFKGQTAGITSTPSTTTSTTTQPSNTYYGSGTITSPGYPSLYPNNLNATYILQALPGKIVRITFNRINTERCCDVITVYDGKYEDDKKVIISLSGDHSSPETYQSTGTYMTIRFLTDAVLEEDGFTADFVSYGSGTPPSNKCQDGWDHDPSQQYCYKYFPNGGPWSQNLLACSNLGAQLLTIHNSQQETYIETFIYNSQLGSQNSLVWIGLHYQFDDWGWSDGSALSYTDWLTGEPSIAGDCAAIQTFNNKNGWKVVDCNTVLPYVCYHQALSV